MWSADKHLVESTRERRDKLLAELVAAGKKAFDPGDEAMRRRLLDLFEVLGVRSFLRLEAEDVAPSRCRKDLEALAPAALEAIDFEALDSAAEDILQKAAELRLAEGEARAALERELADLLSVRDRVELVVEGARAVLGTGGGHELDLPFELETSIAAFEGLLKEEVWRLLPLGALRTDKILWVEPSLRKRFWWREMGMDLPATALDDLDTAARVIHLFPAAREELEKLVAAERTLESFRMNRNAGSGGGSVVSLKDYVRRCCAGTAQEDDARYIRLAAAEQKEVRIHQFPKGAPKPRITISSDGAQLIVDIDLTYAAAGKVPYLVVEGGPTPLELLPVSMPKGRFKASLDSPQFMRAKGKLVVPLDTGEVVIALPFEE